MGVVGRHSVDSLSDNLTIEFSVALAPEAHRWLRVRELTDERLVFEASAYPDKNYDVTFRHFELRCGDT